MSRIQLTRTVLENSILSERQLRDLISGTPPPPNQRRIRTLNINTMTRPYLVDLLERSEIEYRLDAIARDVYSELTDAEKVLSILRKAELIELQDPAPGDNESIDRSDELSELTDDDSPSIHETGGNQNQNPQSNIRTTPSGLNPPLPVSGDQPQAVPAVNQNTPVEVTKLQVFLSLRDEKSEYKLAQTLKAEFPIPYSESGELHVQHDAVIYAVETCIKNSPFWVSDSETLTVFDNQTNVLHLQREAYKHLQGGLVRCSSACADKCDGTASFASDFETLTQVSLPNGASRYPWWSSEEYAKFIATRTSLSTRTGSVFRIDLCLARSISHAFHPKEDQRPTKKPRRHLRNAEVKQQAAQERHNAGTALIKTLFDDDATYEAIITAFKDKQKTYKYLETFRWAVWFYAAWCDTTDDEDKPLDMTVWQSVLQHQADGWLTYLAKSGQIIRQKGGSAGVLDGKGTILQSFTKGSI
ncbi:hypothetical protein GGX14DRAFT_387801 [Mycena pura]|uniref:Uncharacterized protein n=1 Tax=Mycena pura TaxID=153505 RepID=A0AAD6YMF5_9AGAR|nr:hypothetical protein GGX14DRAFT_387801 [Mycena pura]